MTEQHSGIRHVLASLDQRNMSISEIRIGPRHRKELGDVAGLAASIEAVGLLHPIVLTPRKNLIAGQRRLAAVRSLGWREVPVRVVDIEAIVYGEREENTARKDFVPSEAVAVRNACIELERKKAKERQAQAGGTAPGKLPEAVTTGDSRDRSSRGTGYAARTLDKAAEIVEAAEVEPKRFGKLLADMDRTGRVNGPYKRLVVARKAEAIRREPPPLPDQGPYRVIAADPPWPYEIRNDDPSHRATQPYPQMSIAEMRALDVGVIAHEDCILWLWTTNHHMREAFTVLEAWGFHQKTILTWVKHKMSTGDWLRGRTEHCLMATRGKPVVQLTNQTTVIFAPVRGHSEKPDEFYDFVEGLCPAPRYAELFQRTPRANWDGHGDEVDR